VAVFISGAVTGAILYLWLEPLLFRLGATQTIMVYALDYSRILILGSFVTILNMTLGTLLRSEGAASYSMLSILAGTAANVILDPLFIFVLDMGIRGAAVATIVGQMLTLTLIIRYYRAGRADVRIRIAFSWPHLVEIVGIGFAPLLGNLLVGLVIALMNNAARSYGDSVVAAVGITLRIVSFGMFLVFGYAQGFRPLVGYNFGARRLDRVREAFRSSLAIVSLFCVVFAIAMLVFAEPILRIFSSDPDVIGVGSRILRSANALFPLFGFQVLLIALYQAMGIVWEAAVLTFSRLGVFLCLAVVVLPPILGLEGIILSPVISDALILLVSVGFWLGIRRRLRD
jgi:putative MATE family efflux protein